LFRRSSSFPKPEKPAASGTATAVVGAVGAVIVGGGCYFMYKEKNVSGLSYAHKLAIQKVMDSEDLELRLDSPMYCFSTVSELRQYYKENEVSTKEFNPGGINFTSNDETEPGYRFSFFVKGPNEGYAARRAALVHACLRKENDELYWKYLVGEIYDVREIHKKSAKQLTNPVLIHNANG